MTPTLGEKHLEFWSEHLEDPSFVYLIQGDPGTPVKIGVAKDPLKRMRELQTGNPSKLHLQYVIPGDAGLERHLHNRARRGAVLGEWFDGPDVAALQLLVERIAGIMVKAFRATGRVPDFWELLPREYDWANDSEDEGREFYRDLPEHWPTISSMWLDGASEPEIGYALGITTEHAKHILSVMRRKGGYELSTGARRVRDQQGYIPGRFTHRNGNSAARRAQPD